jgi:conjugal transfer/entry exclusion protein
VAEASKTAEERIDALAADLAKAHGELNAIKAQPAPGGPVLARTATQQQQARNTDADQMRAEARQLQLKADQVSDRTLRDGYLERANALLAKADA